VLWYVFPDGKIMFLVQFLDIGSRGGNHSSQKIHDCFDKSLPLDPVLIRSC
jgi:hypothetical protein